MMSRYYAPRIKSMGIITNGFVFSAISGIISPTLYIEMEEKVTGVKLTGAQEDRLRGAILGAACGNALGGSCVGLNHKEILGTAGARVLRDFVPGLTRSQYPEHKPGQVLSDFLLGKALADIVIDNKGSLDKESLKNKFKVLLEDKEFLSSGPGAHCLASLRRLVDELPPSEDSIESTHVSGAARAFTLGCLPEAKNGNSRESMAMLQAELTHHNKSVAAAAAVIAKTIAGLIQGIDLESEENVKKYVGEQLAFSRSIDERFADFWDDVAPDLDYSSQATDIPYSLVNVEPSVFECVPSAVGLFLIFCHDLEEVIYTATHIGGDTDTVALIVGALAGAYHGASKLPARWVENLENREAVEKLAEAIIQLWQA